MKTDLKNEVIEFVTVIRAHSEEHAEWANDLLSKLTRKRGRVKGQKYPRKMIEAPMLGRQLDVSMLVND